MNLVATWAHRALRGAAGYHHCRDEPEYCERYRDHADEDLIGVYENPPGITPRVVVITEEGMYMHGEEGVACLKFHDLLSIRGPDDKTGSGRIQVAERNGHSSTIRIEGGNGKFRDVYSMVRFLDRVVAQKRGVKDD
jgi:hypothetical protein